MDKKIGIFSVLFIGLVLISLVFLGITSGLSTELGPTADARVEQSDPLKNFGTSVNLIVRSKFDGETVYDNMRSFIIFDLSSLPAGANISSATLKLYMQDAPGVYSRTYEVYRVVETWNESTITWDNQPGVESTATSNTLTGTDIDVWLSWDVTTDVQDFHSGSLTNYGWMIRDMVEDSGTGRWAEFRSREYSDNETLRPKLEITYTTTTTSTTSTTSSTTTESTTTTTSTTTSSTTTTTTSSTTTTTTTTTTSTSTTTTTMPQITGTFIRFINSEDLEGVINNVNGINLEDYTPTYIHVYGYLKRFVEEDRISGLITFTSVGSLEVTRTLHYVKYDETITEEKDIKMSLTVNNFDSCHHFARNRMNCKGSGILIIHGAGKDTRLELNDVEFDIKDDILIITGNSLFSASDLPIRIMKFY